MQCLVAKLENGSITEREYRNEVDEQDEQGSPNEVTASIRLINDVRALVSMFNSSDAPEVNLRSREIVTVIYGFETPLGLVWGRLSRAEPDSVIGSVFGALTTPTSLPIGESLPTSWNP